MRYMLLLSSVEKRGTFNWSFLKPKVPKSLKGTLKVVWIGI